MVVKKLTPKPKRTPTVEESDPLSRIQNVSEIPTDAVKLKLGIYGKSGSGKTTFIGTCPKPLLILDCHAGVESILDIPGVSRLVVKDVDDVITIINHLKNNPEQYQTIALDHASRFQDIVLQKVLRLDKLPNQLSWGTATQEQWGFVALGMKDIMADLIALPIHVVIAAQEREFNTEGNAGVLDPYVSFGLSPSVASWLAPALDHIVHAHIRSVKKKVKTEGGMKVKSTPMHAIHTAPSDVYTTKIRKVRGKTLPEVIVDPTFDKLYELIVGT